MHPNSSHLNDFAIIIVFWSLLLVQHKAAVSNKVLPLPSATPLERKHTVLGVLITDYVAILNTLVIDAVIPLLNGNVFCWGSGGQNLFTSVTVNPTQLLWVTCWGFIIQFCSNVCNDSTQLFGDGGSSGIAILDTSPINNVCSRTISWMGLWWHKQYRDWNWHRGECSVAWSFGVVEFSGAVYPVYPVCLVAVSWSSLLRLFLMSTKYLAVLFEARLESVSQRLVSKKESLTGQHVMTPL